MRAFRHGLFLLVAAAGLAAEPAIEFSGVLAAGRDTKVALRNRTTGQSAWVKLGQEFGGYAVTAYEAAGEAVVLTKDGVKFRIAMKQTAKVAAGASADPSPEIKRAILNNLRQLAAAADQYYLENGKAQTTLDELVGETKYVKRLVPADGEDYRQLVFAQGKPLIVTTPGGYTTRYEP